MSLYFIFIVGNIFYSGDMQISFFDMLKIFSFSEKNQEQRPTPFFLISLEIGLFVQMKFFD